VCSLALLSYAAAWLHGGVLAGVLKARGCASLSIRDRFDRPLRLVRPTCAPRAGRQWLRYDELPALLREIAVFAEDRRFELHPGVDVLAVARAAFHDLRARRVVSGASTLTMQLVRMIAPEAHARHGWLEKLRQAWSAFALERRLSKREILEAYFNLAFFGQGAYGVGDAAETYFGKPLAHLDDSELSLLAVLPRAPSGYDLRRHLPRAQRRRSQLLARMIERGALSPERRAAIERGAIQLSERRTPPPFRAGHFVDWALAQLPRERREAGGVLTTTLDLDLQQRLEALVRAHVQRLTAAGVREAGVVVLDSASGEVRALVGSHDYDDAQLDIVTRRRQLGSLLKPFVYALALEAGASADSVALDVGDVPSAYRARDWIGREAGPLSYREALAGSYNLAAVHVLERTGVAALHARLQRAGILPPTAAVARYGVALALGSAGVRLIDLAAGYGCLVRDGAVRRAHGVVRWEGAGGAWSPEQRDVPLFSAQVSARVREILQDPAARHLRFGRGLPLDGPDLAPVVLKTGTASGMSDVSAILACREYTVAAWSGRFDGAPTHGMSGMWGALPLAQRALRSALAGRAPSLPNAVDSFAAEDVVHDPNDPALAAWAERARALGRRTFRTR
jgi:penicillin-binding protein 1C